VLELKFIVFILLIGCIASDIGGYFFGKIFKGPKLTRISPNKTYAGVVGSLLFSLIAISCLFFYFIDIFNYSVVIISLITSISCQLGDLLFSFLKRKAKVKDTGSILPGHGGILDRLDGIFLGVPMGFLTLILIG
jgi:phosphatidate cytidylyltransferase